MTRRTPLGLQEREGQGVDGLLRLVAEHDELACLEGPERRAHLRAVLADVVAADELDSHCERVERSLFGFGPLEDLLSDPEVTDILVDGPSTIWVERAGQLLPAEVAFTDRDELSAFARRLIVRAGARIDQQRPIADCVMASGERVHVVLPPIAVDGPVISIRRHAPEPLSLSDLVARSMLTADQADELAGYVEERACIAISGGTGTGKTTLLRCLLALAHDDRIVVIEETPELGWPTPRVVSLVARARNLEGKGAVDLEALVHASLRMRPDRIVVGEVRGTEAAAALWAMSTGHKGSMLTVHSSEAGAVSATLARLAGPPLTATDFAQHLDVIVQLERRRGHRRVVAIERP